MLYVENMRTDCIDDPRLLDLEFLRPSVMATEKRNLSHLAKPNVIAPPNESCAQLQAHADRQRWSPLLRR